MGPIQGNPATMKAQVAMRKQQITQNPSGESPKAPINNRALAKSLS